MSMSDRGANRKVNNCKNAENSISKSAKRWELVLQTVVETGLVYFKVFKLLESGFKSRSLARRFILVWYTL